jgi:hypothetical protein
MILNKKPFTLLLLYAGVLALLLASCSKKAKEELPGVYTCMQRYDDKDYLVRLSFEESGTLKWEPVDSIPGHTASVVSYSTDGSALLVYNDPDCGSDGNYSWGLSDGILSLRVVSDDCLPRQHALAGAWSRVE